MRIDRRLSVAFLLVGLIGGPCGGGMLLLPARSLVQAARASTWRKVPARVKSVALVTQDDGMMTVNAQYLFDWEGTRRGGTGVSFLGRSTSEEHRRQFEEIKAAHESERPIEALGESEDPRESVVYPELDTGMMPLAAIGLMFFVPALGFGLYGLASLLGGRGSGSATRRGAFLPTIVARPEGGKFTLVDAEDTWRGHGVIALFALFWNTLVWMFVAVIGGAIATGELQGGRAVFPALFMVPFVLVGLGLIYAWLKRVRVTRRMPAGRLTVEHWPICPGEAVEATFRRPLRGASGGEDLHVFEAELQIHEEATYTVGTDSRTDTATAASHPVEPDDPGVDREGIHARFLLQIPAEGPCSFQSPSNLVTWRLHLTMQASGYPKDDSVFDLLVLPLGGARVMITIERSDAQVAAGGTMRGRIRARTESGKAPRAVVIVAGWRTEGRGRCDKADASTVRIEPRGSRAEIEEDFELAIPAEGPVSYDGELVRIIWELDIRLDIPWGRDETLTRVFRVTGGK